jgi:putative PIN family toxin of toxin-antitoxin system
VRIVLDTNVLVSGLLSPGGPPGRILDLAATRAVVVLYDDRVMAEYREVLTRPHFSFGVGRAAALLEFVQLEGELVPSPPLAITLPDPDDLPFLEVAAAGFADALVTGNRRHFAPITGTHDVRVLSPMEFITLWIERRSSRPA